MYQRSRNAPFKLWMLLVITMLTMRYMTRRTKQMKDIGNFAPSLLHRPPTMKTLFSIDRVSTDSLHVRVNTGQ